MIKVNGDAVQNAEGLTFSEYLFNTAGYTKGRIAVECNGDIVPSKEYETRVIKDGDTIEVVAFVGGG